jgi:excinuclease UvrABC helicase subunit UvrB
MIINNKILNQQLSAQGYGRLESSSFDKFILYRRVNQPELIFNQSINKDMYFEKDSSLNW